eukprot:jgi/Phyca11/537797/estExt2_fgenesh1_pg.C_PHYCAscaffold_1580002
MAPFDAYRAKMQAAGLSTEAIKAFEYSYEALVPKVDASNMEPAEFPANPSKEWCPPGHGDLYASLAGSGKLDKLVADGVKYMFVSNSDNLGATLDLDLLTYFAQSGKPFLMECCERTENDKKGGHLAERTADGRLILRESAQCADEDEKDFQNITKHQRSSEHTVTNEIFAATKVITSYKIAADFPTIDVGTIGTTTVDSDDGSRTITIEVFDAAEHHVDLLKQIFDFHAIKKLVSRPDFTFVVDAMSGVNGPYARRVFVEELGCDESCLQNATPLEDFGGGHADPNLTYAKALIKVMGVDPKGLPVHGQEQEPPSFGAAWDGDADRNMILGSRFFVTPSDSLAIIAANCTVIPFFKNGLRVGKEINGFKYEEPTGNLDQNAAAALEKLIEVGLKLSDLEKKTGRKAPTVIT